MSGSKQKFLYETDVPLPDNSGNYYLVLNLDESNSRAVGGIIATQAAIDGSTLLPRDAANKVTPRYINLQGVTAAGRPVKRRIVCPNPSNDVWRRGGTLQLSVSTGALAANNENVTFLITSAIGEKRTFFTTATPDTGLDDTTQP